MNWGKGDVDICLHIKVLWTVHTPRTYVLTVYEAVAWSTTVLKLTGPQQGHKQHSFIVVTISQQLVTAEGKTIFHTLSQHEHTRLITTHITNHWYTLCLSTCVHSTDNVLMYLKLHISITIIYINRNTYVYVFQVLHVHAYLYNMIVFLCVWYVKERNSYKFFKILQIDWCFRIFQFNASSNYTVCIYFMYMYAFKTIKTAILSSRFEKILWDLHLEKYNPTFEIVLETIYICVMCIRVLHYICTSC